MRFSSAHGKSLTCWVLVKNLPSNKPRWYSDSRTEAGPACPSFVDFSKRCASVGCILLFVLVSFLQWPLLGSVPVVWEGSRWRVRRSLLHGWPRTPWFGPLLQTYASSSGAGFELFKSGPQQNRHTQMEIAGEEIGSPAPPDFSCKENRTFWINELCEAVGGLPICSSFSKLSLFLNCMVGKCF